MGNGVGTALANRVAMHLGGIADEVSVARLDSYDALGLVTSGDSYSMDQKTQDSRQKSTLGARDQCPHQFLDRRACRYPCVCRGREGHFSFRAVAGGA